MNEATHVCYCTIPGPMVGPILDAHDTRSPYETARIQCAYPGCGLTASIFDSGNRSDADLAREFRSEGWTVRLRGRKSIRCPDHRGKRVVAAEAARP